MKIDNPQPEPGAAALPGSRWKAYLHKDWLRCLLLALVGFVVRVPALQGQLIWDDQFLARDNPFIKSPIFVIEVFRHYLFVDSSSPHYRPVQNLSLMLDYALWNANTFGFHLTNLLLHVAGGLLLYFLLRRLLNSLRNRVGGMDNSLVALLVAAIWIAHPVHSAAVDYISGRADSLAFTFACAGWLAFLRAREASGNFMRIALYLGSAMSALVALCSRESACIWLGLFLLHLLFFGQESKRTKWLATISCLLVLTLYAGLRQLPDQRSLVHSSAGPPLPFRAVLMLRALGDYTRLMIFPANLHMERSVMDPAAFQSVEARRHLIGLEYLSLVGFAAAAFMVLLAFRRSSAQKVRLFGALWFGIGFLPISNLVDLNATVAEHWLYLPSVGFFIFLAGCVLDFPAQWRRAAGVLAGVAVLGFGVRSFVRSGDWIDPETFYQRTADAGGMTGRIGVNLGQTYALRGKYKEAEKIFRSVLRLQPDYTVARNNLADALAHLGKEDEAKVVLADATRAAHTSMKDYPRTWVAALNFAHLLSRRQDLAGALAVLEKARLDYPDTWELLAAESEIFRGQEKFDAAIALIRPYADEHWWHYDAWMAFGRVLAEKADVDLAEVALRHASWLDIGSTDALNLIAIMRMGQNRLDEAWRAQRRAVARQPDQPRQYVLLSNILEKMGRDVEARAALAQVSRLRAMAGAEKAAN